MNHELSFCSYVMPSFAPNPLVSFPCSGCLLKQVLPTIGHDTQKHFLTRDDLVVALPATRSSCHWLALRPSASTARVDPAASLVLPEFRRYGPRGLGGLGGTGRDWKGLEGTGMGGEAAYHRARVKFSQEGDGLCHASLHGKSTGVVLRSEHNER